MKCEHCERQEQCQKLDALKYLARTTWTPESEKALEDPGKFCPRFKCNHDGEPFYRETYLEYIAYCKHCGKKL